MKTISFIIPVYNCKYYLPDCVASIRAAGVGDYEILLIDDGSTDGSAGVCDELAERFPEIRVIHQVNAGVSAARNRGIQEAHGEYIIFVDSDDTLLPFDNSVFLYLEKNIDMLIFGMKFQYYHKGSFVKEETAAINWEMTCSAKEVGENFAQLFNSNYFSPVWNKIIKKSILAENKLTFDTRLINYEDMAFSLLVLSRCSTVVVVPQVYYLYRVDYDHDKTVDRIAKIKDIMGNTDIIAELFLEFEQAAIAAGATDICPVRECLLSIYFELFYTKMRTAGISVIGQYCNDFKEDEYVKQCLKRVKILPKGQQRWYRWILQENKLAIWMYVRYLQFRHFCARNVKRWIRRIQR